MSERLKRAMAWVRFGLYRNQLEMDHLVDVTRKASDSIHSFAEACGKLPLSIVEE